MPPGQRSRIGGPNHRRRPRIMLLTSANFSWSAENSNIELGLLIHDSTLAASIEQLMRTKHGLLYEPVAIDH